MQKEIKIHDNDLIKLIKNKNCSDSFNEIQERHSKLFYSICNKFIDRMSLDELLKDRNFVIFKSIMSFDESKGVKYSTWLGNFTKYHCLNYMKKNKKYVAPDEEKVMHFYNTKSLTDYNETKGLKDEVDHAFSVLRKLNDKRIFKIFKLRYLHEGPKLTWKEIAKQFDLTPQTIINLHMKGRRILKNKMKKNP